MRTDHLQTLLEVARDDIEEGVNSLFMKNIEIRGVNTTAL